MRIFSPVMKPVVTALIVFAMSSCAASPAAAQEVLRWKFEEGQKLNYNMTQDMSITSPGGGGQKMDMHQEMDMSWSIADVTPEGDALIRQKFNRLQVKMTMPPVGTIEYDSDAKDAPQGFAAMIAPMYKAMMEAEFELTMDPRGHIKEVKVPEQVITALKNSPGGAAMGEMATPEGFKKMISQSALVLPEKAPQPGEEWATMVEMNNPAGGKQVVETTYRYEGTKEVEGTEFAVFKPTITMKFEGVGEQLKVTAQESDGEILFNADAGRLHSSELNQKITLEQAGAGEVTIDQKIQAKVTPAEDAEAEKK